MARKGYQGESPKDRAANIMDKFIQRSDKKKQLFFNQYGRTDKSDIESINLWPLQDQLEYWDNLSSEDWFKKSYSYSTWYSEVMDRSGMYPSTFLDCISQHKKLLKELFDQCTKPTIAVNILRNKNILH